MGSLYLFLPSQGCRCIIHLKAATCTPENIFFGHVVYGIADLSLMLSVDADAELKLLIVFAMSTREYHPVHSVADPPTVGISYVVVSIGFLFAALLRPLELHSEPHVASVVRQQLYCGFRYDDILTVEYVCVVAFVQNTC